MAAPTPTVRQSPPGIKLEDGYQSLITVALDPDIDLFEISVTPPGMDGGDPINQTTMHNVLWRTTAPRSLITLTDSQMKCAYDPIVYTQLLAVLNTPTTLTHRWCDGSTLAYYGWARSATPDEEQEGTQPSMTVVLHSSNFDPVNHVEAGPVLTSVSGT